MTGAFQKDTQFSATAAQAKGQVLTMVAGNGRIGYIPAIPLIIECLGYNKSPAVGTLNATSIDYKSSTYQINTLGYITRNAAGTVGHSTSIIFDTTPPFTKLVFDINGTKITFTQNSSDKTTYNASTNYIFASGQTYTIKVISIT